MIGRFRIVRFLLAALVFSTVSLTAADVIPPKPAGYFNDYAGVVGKETALQLNEKLAQFERDTSVQIVAAVFRKMESDSSIEDYTRRIARAWDIGQAETKNGAALFVFIEDHKMFIQTNRGLEGALPDATCFDITHNLIAPRFKTGDYAGGLIAGLDAMMQAVRGEYKGSGKTVAESHGSANNGSAVPFFIIFLIVMILIARASRKRGRGFSGRGPFIGPFIGGWGGGAGGFGGGSSGGGFSGFSGGGGGGGFGGGGAGSSW